MAFEHIETVPDRRKCYDVIDVRDASRPTE